MRYTAGMEKNALILFAHGARDPNWALPAQRVAEETRRLRPDALVSVAFLELMTPTLATPVASIGALASVTSGIVTPRREPA